MQALLAILKLVPYLALGITQIHTDLSVADKQTAASDGLSILVAGAKTMISPEESELADKIGAIASDTMNRTIDALHPKTATK